MRSAGPGLNYPAEVVVSAGVDELADYRRAARVLAEYGVQAALIRYADGMYGGPNGAHILDLAQELRRHGIAADRQPAHGPGRRAAGVDPYGSGPDRGRRRSAGSDGDRANGRVGPTRRHGGPGPRRWRRRAGGSACGCRSRAWRGSRSRPRSPTRSATPDRSSRVCGSAGRVAQADSSQHLRPCATLRRYGRRCASSWYGWGDQAKTRNSDWSRRTASPTRFGSSTRTCRRPTWPCCSPEPGCIWRWGTTHGSPEPSPLGAPPLRCQTTLRSRPRPTSPVRWPWRSTIGPAMTAPGRRPSRPAATLAGRVSLAGTSRRSERRTRRRRRRWPCPRCASTGSIGIWAACARSSPTATPGSPRSPPAC